MRDSPNIHRYQLGDYRFSILRAPDERRDGLLVRTQPPGRLAYQACADLTHDVFSVIAAHPGVPVDGAEALLPDDDGLGQHYRDLKLAGFFPPGDQHSSEDQRPPVVLRTVLPSDDSDSLSATIHASVSLESQIGVAIGFRAEIANVPELIRIHERFQKCMARAPIQGLRVLTVLSPLGEYDADSTTLLKALEICDWLHVQFDYGYCRGDQTTHRGHLSALDAIDYYGFALPISFSVADAEILDLGRHSAIIEEAQVLLEMSPIHPVQTHIKRPRHFKSIGHVNRYYDALGTFVDTLYRTVPDLSQVSLTSMYVDALAGDGCPRQRLDLRVVSTASRSTCTVFWFPDRTNPVAEFTVGSEVADSLLGILTRTSSGCESGLSCADCQLWDVCPKVFPPVCATEPKSVEEREIRAEAARRECQLHRSLMAEILRDILAAGHEAKKHATPMRISVSRDGIADFAPLAVSRAAPEEQTDRG